MPEAGIALCGPMIFVIHSRFIGECCGTQSLVQINSKHRSLTLAATSQKKGYYDTHELKEIYEEVRSPSHWSCPVCTSYQSKSMPFLVHNSRMSNLAWCLVVVIIIIIIIIIATCSFSYPRCSTFVPGPRHACVPDSSCTLQVDEDQNGVLDFPEFTQLLVMFYWKYVGALIHLHRFVKPWLPVPVYLFPQPETGLYSLD